MNIETFSRKKLYDLAWSKSMSALSKMYAMSDNGLRKICKKMNIPLPDNGYWAKLKFGKKLKTKPMLFDSTCEQQVELELRKEGEEYIENPIKKLAKQIEVIVPNNLSSPDPLIISARQSLASKNAKAYNYVGMVECKGGQVGSVSAKFPRI